MTGGTVKIQERFDYASALPALLQGQKMHSETANKVRMKPLLMRSIVTNVTRSRAFTGYCSRGWCIYDRNICASCLRHVEA